MRRWMRGNRTDVLKAASLLVFLLVVGCGVGSYSVLDDTGGKTGPTSGPSIWVGTWGAPMSDASGGVGGDNAGGSEKTFRFLVRTTIDGDVVRIKFSNVYGTTPVTIGAAHVGVGHTGTAAVDAGTDAALTFNNGSASVVLPAGGMVTSDPARVSFEARQQLAVSVYLKGMFGPVSRHDSYFITNYQTANGAGNTTADLTGGTFTSTLEDWLLVNEVDTYGQYDGTLVLFGSSTTDGFKSNFGDTAVYPTPNVAVAGQTSQRPTEWMSRRLIAAGYRIGVLNGGIPGDTVTTLSTGGSVPATVRVGYDVLQAPSLLGVVTYFGSIDLRSSDCVSAPAMETATTQMVAQIHAAGVPVVMATLPPSAFCTNAAQANYGPVPVIPSNPYAGGLTPGPANGAEVQRAAFNGWVRTVGASLPGVYAIADYDVALRDPAHTSFMLPQYNAGDNQHMNGNGYEAEINTVPLGFLPKN